MNEPFFPFSAKALFYFQYFTSKVFRLWFDVRRPKLKMFIYEMIYSAAKFRDYNTLIPSPFHTDRVDTVFGSYKIRPRTLDMSIVSPAFERPDVDRLLSLMENLFADGRAITFADVGADLGTYSVTVGNRFRTRRLRILAFEPSPQSAALVRENLSLNSIEQLVNLCEAPLYHTDGQEITFHYNSLAPGSSSMGGGGSKGDTGISSFTVTTRTFDSVLDEQDGDFPRDVLVMKIDVEGVEQDVIEGARQSMEIFTETILLVEDFVNPAIIEYLRQRGAELIAKVTPYNSFWRYVPAHSDKGGAAQ